MPTVGERIRKRRIELGWTQEFLSQQAGISKGFLSDLENDKRSIGAETLLDLGRALGVSLDFLMVGEESGDRTVSSEIPPSLAQFAAEEGLSVRDTLTLLRMQEQIVGARKGRAGRKLNGVDWKDFYSAVKRFL